MPPIWIDPKEVAVPNSLQDIAEGHPLIAETLVRRGIRNPEEARAFLDPAQYTSTPAAELLDIDKAATRIFQAIESGETILVWGDFDVDGQTSTTLLVEALSAIGAQVEFHIPIRATEGHGIKIDVLQQIVSESQEIGVLLTCDTGIAEIEAVEFANKSGIDVIITDHHDLPETLPAALAIIDPKMLPNDHPLATLPGVGVAYKLVEALFENHLGSNKGDHSIEKYLDLVALGIVADVAELRGDTRYLLQKGLRVLQNTQRLGLNTLMELAQIIPDQLDEGHIGFGIGPRLNALGRLSDANSVVEFLTTSDASRARVLATQLEGLNEHRKLLTAQITQAALAQIDQDPTLLEKAALVLAHPGWHTGVIGIVASRLVEQFGKPTILLSIGDDGMARGSARSIEGVHITEAIATQRELLSGFGGHPGAAGLALPADDIPIFRRGLGQAVRTQLGDREIEPSIQIDAFLSLDEISLELVDEIRQLAPFGNGTPPLIFASQNLRLINHTKIGRGKEHLRLVVADESDAHQDVLWWNGTASLLPAAEATFDLAYTIQASTYRGERQLQIQWVDIRSLTPPNPEAEADHRPIEIVDLQEKSHPWALLKSIQAEHDVQIWAEGKDKTKVDGLDRSELEPCDNLVVWTTPPSPREWHTALDQVQPKTIYIFAIDPGLDQLESFISRLAGLAKFSLRTKGGAVNLETFARAMSHSVETIKVGLLWMQAKGYFQISRRDEDVYYLLDQPGKENPELAAITAELSAMLAETSAYRAYFRKSHQNLN